jgi:flavin-dependent dehydrogenase
MAAGAELRYSWKVTGIRDDDDDFVVTGSSELRCSHVIGADGPCSSAAAALGFSQPSEYVQALQTVIPVNDALGEVDVWVGNDVAPGFFAWRIPAGGTTRVGLGVSAGQGVMHYFQRLLRRLDLEPHEVQAGLIPMEMSRRFCTYRAALIGDAAGQVKATSGGGLYPGLVAARCLADTLENDTTDYRRAFMQSYGRELKRSAWFRRRFIGLSDGDMNRLLGMVDADIAATVTAYGDIDFPSRAVKKVVGRHPSLLRFLLPF